MSRRSGQGPKALVFALGSAIWCCGNVARAHPGVATTAVCTVQPGVGDAGPRLSIVIHHDALAFMLNDTSKAISDGPMNALLDDPSDVELERLASDARERFETLTVVEVGGQRLPAIVEHAPSVADIRAWAATKKPRLPVKMDVKLVAELPFDASQFSIALPDVLGPVVFTYASTRGEPEVRLLNPGEPARAFELPARLIDTVATTIDGTPLKAPSQGMEFTTEIAVVGGLIGLGVVVAAVAVAVRRRAVPDASVADAGTDKRSSV